MSAVCRKDRGIATGFVAHGRGKCREAQNTRRPGAADTRRPAEAARGVAA
jgi:hypothetical protein